MAKRTIKVPFSQDGLNKAADWLEDYAKRTLPKNIAALIGQMTRQGESWAINLMGHIDTGETLSSIHGIRNGNKGVIVAGGNAVWIEFGTGVYAPGQTDHPLLGQVEGIVPHGTYGKGHGASPNGWWYPDPEGTLELEDEETGEKKRYSHTMGIPANMFMYNTAQMLKREFPQMAKEIFSK